MTQTNQKTNGKQPRPPNTRIAEFVAKLNGLDAGGKARLKRDAGKDMSEARSLGLFYRLLPFGVAQEREKDYFLVATLYPLADPGKTGCLGDALNQAHDPDPAKNKGLDRRIETLLDADATQLPFRLRQAVRFLKSNRIPIDWQELTEDVLNWGSPYRSVQKKWARAYFKLNAKPSAEDAKSPDTIDPTDE